jgi:hypothetical protein
VTNTSRYLDTENLATLRGALQLAVEPQAGLFGYFEQ